MYDLSFDLASNADVSSHGLIRRREKNFRKIPKEKKKKNKMGREWLLADSKMIDSTRYLVNGARGDRLVFPSSSQQKDSGSMKEDGCSGLCRLLIVFPVIGLWTKPLVRHVLFNATILGISPILQIILLCRINYQFLLPSFSNNLFLSFQNFNNNLTRFFFYFSFLFFSTR